MMQASGTSEGLRGLIDGPLPKSVKKIIQYRGLFGPAIFSIGNIRALLPCFLAHKSLLLHSH